MNLFHETKTHGTTNFPFIIYHSKIPEFLTSYPLHWHSEMELIYVRKGNLNVTVWSQTYAAKEGDILILLPHTLHAIEQSGTLAAEYFNILFDFSLLGEKDSDPVYAKYLLPFITHQLEVTIHEEKNSSLNVLLTPFLLSLIENRRSSYDTHELLVKANLFGIMHHLYQHSVPWNADHLTPFATYHKLKTALYHVQNSYSHPISIKEVADLCGFSESHFMKLFKELTGVSFTNYLTNYRLELAAEQLRSDARQSVIQVATNCGFNNHSYFTRVFQKKYKMTPTAYRRSHLT